MAQHLNTSIPLAKRLANRKEGKGYRNYRCGAYNPPTDQPLYGENHVRWVEDTDRAGLRSVGYADEVYRGISHRGWFTNEFQDEVYRGIVFRLPARHGEGRFVYGYEDPNNPGAALLSFDPCDEEKDAARWADRFAERSAEEEREYQEAWQARRRFDDLDDDVKTARELLINLCGEARAARRLSLPNFPKICGVIRGKVSDLLEEIKGSRQKRAELEAGYSRHAAWRDA
jgi:hypothetical protein